MKIRPVRPILQLTLLLLLATGCSRSNSSEASNFVEEFDPGKVVESFLGILWGDPEMALQNKTFFMYWAPSDDSYLKVFDFVPNAEIEDRAGLVGGLRDSIRNDLEAEGFEVTATRSEERPDDIILRYRSDRRTGTVQIFTVRTADNDIKVTGVIHESPLASSWFRW